LVSIIPTVADQLTPVVSLVTVAANWTVWPVVIAVACGPTATLMGNGAIGDGAVGDGAVGDGATWPHPAAKMIRHETAQTRTNFRPIKRVLPP
jgi:hypothetical protein